MMALQTHGDEKYRSSEMLSGVAEWDCLRVEHRRVGPGPQNGVRPRCTELNFVLSGQTRVRRCADGKFQEGMAVPGTSWLVPAGANETLFELEGEAECLIVFLPAEPLDAWALHRLGLDPQQSRLAYAGGITDAVLVQIGNALRGLVGETRRPTDDIFADGLGQALAAHLVGHYSLGTWSPDNRIAGLEPRRLQRVLDYIEARLGESISLLDLAGEACLSPFHFSRQFHEATGQTAHRYLTERRIIFAKTMISDRRNSLTAVALDSGFGSSANFSRVFRKMTGLSPRQYRAMFC